MNTKITMAVLASVSLVLGAILATPAMTSPVYASYDKDGEKDGEKDGKKKCKAGNSGKEWPGNGPHKCPPGLRD